MTDPQRLGTEHSGDDDVLTELIKDHNEVRELFAKLSNGAVGDEREQLVREMTEELVKHSVAEEVYLYPLIREVLPGGDSTADHEIEEHSEVEKALKQLEKLDPDETAYQSTIDKVIKDVSHHAQEEEDDVFPQLRQRCTSDQLYELGDKVRSLKRIAPTHPHPSAPNTPPGNKIVGPATGLVDRVRDALTR